MFSNYTKYIDYFADEVQPLVNTKTFPIDRNRDALISFHSLKQKLENVVALHSIDKSKAFVVECMPRILQYPLLVIKKAGPLSSYHGYYRGVKYETLQLNRRLLPLLKVSESGRICYYGKHLQL